MKTRFALVAMVLSALALTSSAAHAQEGPKVTVSPAGTYDLALEREGQAQESVLTITLGKDGRLNGSLALHGMVMPADSIALKGSTMTVVIGTGHGQLTLTLTLSHDNKVSGSWVSTSMGTGGLTGARRKG